MSNSGVYYICEIINKERGMLMAKRKKLVITREGYLLLAAIGILILALIIIAVAVVVKIVPLPSLSIEPPSSTKSRQSLYSPSTMPASYILRLMALSLVAGNFSPQPLNR